MIIFKGDLSPLIIYGCRGGGTGRHAGLKILFHLNEVRVRFSSQVQIKLRLLFVTIILLYLIK